MRCKPRKLFSVAVSMVAVALFALCATSAWAKWNNPQATELYGLKAEYAEGKTRLTWAARVYYYLGYRGQFLVWREVEGKKECIAKLDVPDPKPGESSVVMEYTDGSPPHEECVKYTVEGFGAAGTPSISVTVDTTREADSVVTSPRTGEVDNRTGESEFAQRLELYEEQADWPERLAGNIVTAIPNYIRKVVGLYDPAELIFQVQLQKREISDVPLPSPADAVYLHVFTEKELDAVDAFYQTVSSYVPVWLVLGLVTVGLLAWWSAANPSAKLTFREYFAGFVLGALLLRFGVSLLSFVFDANWMLVKAFQSACDPFLAQDFFSTFYNKETASLGSAILACVAVLCVGVLNFQYAMRKLSIGLLLGVLPVVAIVSIPPQNRRALGVWLRELLSNIFLQSAHAAAFAFLILLMHSLSNSAFEFWTKLTALAGLSGMASLVRRVIGAESIGSGMTAGAGAALGLGTLFAMSRMLSGRPQGQGQGGLGFLGGAGRLALGSAGAAAGSMATSAAGIGPGAGLAVGALAGAHAAGAGYGAGKSFYSFAGEAREKGVSGALEGLNFYDPGMAYQAGRKVFGDNVIGGAAGAAMAGGSWAAGKICPERAAQARAARINFASLQGSLEAGRARLAEMRPDLEATRAEHDYARNMFGPRSANLQEMNQQLSELDVQRAVAEQNLAEAVQSVEESPLWRRREAVEQMIESYQGYNQADHNYNSLQSEIAAGEQRYQDSVKNLQTTEAEYAQQRLEVANLEKKLQSDPVFRRLAEMQRPAPGGLEMRWR
ncbi:MAG: hypothetical protein AB1700_00180 [Bacillota bacterium]